ncbi:MAG: HlyD family efflux transporter periplasmic adaptor subunit [Oscillospiraceae bacterium]|nr:HlyD family efflux transporter periplasmic adaptor subunit [Oscillospiraceae bacterium]
MKKNKLWIPIVAAVLALSVAAGAFLIPRLPKKEVPVYAVSMVGYTDFYSGSAESYGMVTTDKVQTLYVTATQTITEIKVYPGQEVKKGDVLYTYDTTLSDLAVERKDLANQQLEMELKTAQAELKALQKMKPIVYKPGSGSSSTKTDYTKSPTDPNMINQVYSTKTSGTSKSNPLYVWLETTKQVDETFIEYLFGQASGNPNRIYVVFQMTSGNKAGAEFNVQTGICFTKTYETPPTEPTDPSQPTVPSTPEESTEPSQPTQPSQPSVPSQPTEPEVPTEPSQPTQPTEPKEPSQPSEPENPVEPEEPEAPAEPESAGGASASSSTKKLAGYTMTFFTPPSAPKEDNGTVQWNDGYTSAELTAMKQEKQAEIKQLQFDIKMGKAELKIMQKEAANGNVVAEFDGTVSEILEPAEAYVNNLPLMKVTGGGGYYVEGTVSELALSTVTLGQSVTVTSWDTGAVCTGQVVEIGQYPVENQGYGSGNASYYPYRVFIDESADLQEGFYVSLVYQTAEAAAGTLYLQDAFIRSEGNRSYVFVRGAEGLLEKRYLECGVSDGYMTAVYAGITEEDFLAFPYGKEIVEGAPTYEGTDQDLYGY